MRWKYNNPKMTVVVKTNQFVSIEGSSACCKNKIFWLIFAVNENAKSQTWNYTEQLNYTIHNLQCIVLT